MPPLPGGEHGSDEDEEEVEEREAEDLMPARLRRPEPWRRVSFLDWRDTSSSSNTSAISCFKSAKGEVRCQYKFLS
jgi:hypothetical protein